MGGTWGTWGGVIESEHCNCGDYDGVGGGGGLGLQ